VIVIEVNTEAVKISGLTFGHRRGDDAIMRLQEYLEVKGLTLRAFGDKIGVSAESVRRYAAGERMPQRHIMLAIVKATGGAVQPGSFYEKAA
jgi:transcriptional regulator with XRE-family HTH domain